MRMIFGRHKQVSTMLTQLWLTLRLEFIEAWYRAEFDLSILPLYNRLSTLETGFHSIMIPQVRSMSSVRKACI